MNTLAFVFLLSLSVNTNAQLDNGNVFELTWKAEKLQHYGDASEMGTYAPEGLDIDQDGYREFLLFDQYKYSFTPLGRLQLWESTGNDSFQLVWMREYPSHLQKNNPGAGLTVADLDKDGRQEVLIAVEDVIDIYEWDGTTFESGGGLPSEPTKTLLTLLDGKGESIIRSLIVKNLDPDPDLEIFMGYGDNLGLYCVIGSIPGSDFSAPDWKLEFVDDFLSVTDAPPGGNYRVGGVAIDDFDGDGNMEIFTSHWQDISATRVYENDGIDNYVVKHTNVPETLIIYPPFEGAFANVIFHDFDGNGDSEFIISDIHGHIFVITKESSNNFEDFGPDAWIYLMNWPTVPNNGFIRGGFLGDLDQDGKPDIYYNDYQAQGILDLEYQSGPVDDPESWIPYQIYDMPGRRFGKAFPAGDLDGDGLGELVCNMGGLLNGQNLHIIESQHFPIAVEEREIVKAYDFNLCQNFPNPFNPTTAISYSLSMDDEVSLNIYNLQGVVVATLLDGRHQSAGQHSVIWDGKNHAGQVVATGVYLYQLSVGEYTFTKKMSLMK